MNRARWTKTVVFVLAILLVLPGGVWADPTGASNVLQILNFRAFKGFTDPNHGPEQRTFLTTDPITLEATYYDPSDACAGTELPFVQVLFFNLEGQLILSFFGGDGTTQEPDITGESNKFRLLFLDLFPGQVPAGNYQVTFLAKDCPNVNFIISGLHAIRVLAP